MAAPHDDGLRPRGVWILALLVGFALLWGLALLAAHAPTCPRTSGHDWIPCLEAAQRT